MHLHMYRNKFAITFSGKRHKLVILKILHESMMDYKAFDFNMGYYDISELIKVTDRCPASHKMPIELCNTLHMIYFLVD